MSFFEKLEIWKEEYLILKHIFLNFKDYSNINFNFPIGMVLILLAIAFTVAVFIINHRNNTITNCVKQLIRHEAIGEEKAKTLRSLRLDGIRSLKRMLISGGRLSSMVKIQGYSKPKYEDYLKKSKKEKAASEKLDFSTAKIYLSEDKKDTAEAISAIGISPLWKPLLVALGFLAVFTVLFICMPNILELVNSWLAE